MISRAGPVPAYWEYAVRTILTPHASPPSQGLSNLQSTNLYWVDVPTFQRGISWTVDDIEEFLNSESVLLGNVILAQFPVPQNRPTNLQYLPTGQSNYWILVDGLQRLAVGTLLLNLLHDPFLKNQPDRPNEAQHFSSLIAIVQSRAAAYLHNDQQFSNHPRKAIRDQYVSLKTSLCSWINEKISNNLTTDLATVVNRTMTLKQVAIDEYFNFANALELMNTFLGLNTVRVDLGPVDLLRSYLVEKAQSDGWNAIDIESMENEFTELFVSEDRPIAELMPFVKLVLGYIRNTASAALVFPSWPNQLTQSDVDRFLDFVRSFRNCDNNSYFNEIRSCGSLPFTILLSYFYRQLLATGQLPSFLSGGAGENDALHLLLRACYRTVIDGRIGRTSHYSRRCIEGQSDLPTVADDMSTEFLGISMNQNVDTAWLSTSLLKADRNKCKRIFNAMLLPNNQQPLGGVFSPIVFGRKSVDFNVDHLIPNSLIAENDPGGIEGQTIKNFAPLPQNLNRIAKATSCSAKLSTGGIYDTYLQGTTHSSHPYSDWLVSTHAGAVQPAELDDQSKLESNSNPDVGGARLNQIVVELESKL